MVYSYKPKSCIKTPANVAGTVCEELARTGGLTPVRLLDASRDTFAPLHGEFEWDDAVAAEEHRKSQARHIINSIVVISEKDETPPVRAFVHIRDDDDCRYESLGVVLRTPSMHQQMIDNARRELQAFSSKYKQLNELRIVLESIDTFLSNNDE